MSKKYNNIITVDDSIIELWEYLIDNVDDGKIYSQFQYPWFNENKKIWVIGNEPYGWGTDSDYLCKVGKDKLIYETYEFMNSGYKQYNTRGFFKFFQSILDKTSLTIEDIGYWNYYPVGKRYKSGQPDNQLQDLLFDKTSIWKDTFWNTMKKSNAKFIIFTGYYSLSWCDEYNLLNGKVKCYGGDNDFENYKVKVINHPAYRNKNIELERETIDYIKENIL